MSPVESFFRLIVFAASVWISVKYAVGYWVVGPQDQLSGPSHRRVAGSLPLFFLPTF